MKDKIYEIIIQLSEEDIEILEEYYNLTKQPLNTISFTKNKNVIQNGVKINSQILKEIIDMKNNKEYEIV